MPVTARNPQELFPIVLSFASAALLFGLPEEMYGISASWRGWYAPAIPGSIAALLAILFGYRYVKVKGRNAVVWVGVVSGGVMLTLNLAILLNFKIWLWVLPRTVETGVIP